MPSRRVPEPWRSFLADIDAASPAAIEMHCIGGFAVTQHYALDRSTGDLDIFHAIPNDATRWLASEAGRGSAIHKKHKLYVHIAPRWVFSPGTSVGLNRRPNHRAVAQWLLTCQSPLS